LYDFAATEEDTVSVWAGERVVVAGEEDGEGWVEVWVEGAPARRGVVPAAYVRVARATALHDFAATDGDTLSIGKRQRLVVGALAPHARRAHTLPRARLLCPPQLSHFHPPPPRA
jgi:hypothetical protein